MPIRTLIVENDEGASLVLEAHLLNYDFIEVIDSVPTIKEALELTIQQKPDLVFLDIELNDGKAFDYIKELPNHTKVSPEIIFMTAWSDYAVEAYRFLPFAFIEKPFNKPLLKKVIEKLKNSRKESDNTEIIKKWLLEKEKNDSGSKLKLPSKDGFTFIDPDEILYLEAERCYTELFFNPDRTMTVSKNLGKVEDMLKDKGFCRINRSNVINSKYLLSINRKKHECTLYKDGESIHLPIAKDRFNSITKFME